MMAQTVALAVRWTLTAGAGAATGGAVSITTGLGTAASSGTMTLHPMQANGDSGR